MRILGIVVQYFPEKDNVEPLRNHVDEILVVDNSHNNIGVAAALNIGLKKAIEENYDWLLTMDQDSTFEPGGLEKLKSAAFAANETVGWVAPIQRTAKGESVNRYVAMTSGSMLRINACKRTGFFEEKLFIDSVDNEYCLRLRKFGFKILRTDAVLNHSLGTLQDHGAFKAITHNASRRYYITRNMLYVMFKYPVFFLFGLKELTKSFLLILFVESEKYQKIKSMIVGVGDFLRRRYGRFEG